MLPAGEMWSVVTLSPSLASTRAPATSVTGAGFPGQTLEERGSQHVGRVRVPLEGAARGRFHRPPALVTVEHRRVPPAEHLRIERRADGLGDLLGGGPELGQVDGTPVGAGADGIGSEVGVDGPGQGVGHHQRRRGEVVEADVGVDAPLEVAVARQHGGHRQVALSHRLGHIAEQRPGVADAGRAPEADQVEPEGGQGRGEPGPIEVVHHHP